MITVEEIPISSIDEFWDIHYKFLIDDQIITNEEEKKYFSSAKYRDVIKSHMLRSKDVHHMIYFVEDDMRVGAAQYCIYKSEDGKCFILDFWLFSEYRGIGRGYKCFETLEAYTKNDGAVYYQLNSNKEKAIKFWLNNQFKYIGNDRYGVKLFEKRDYE